MGAECRRGGRQRRAEARPLKVSQPSVKISVVLFGAALGSERASEHQGDLRKRDRPETVCILPPSLSPSEHVPPLPNLDRRESEMERQKSWRRCAGSEVRDAKGSFTLHLPKNSTSTVPFNTLCSIFRLDSTGISTWRKSY